MVLNYIYIRVCIHLSLDNSCVGCGIKKKPINVSFESLSTQLHNPTFMSDVGRPIALKQNHLAYITMLQFVAKEGRMPRPYNQSDSEVCTYYFCEI